MPARLLLAMPAACYLLMVLFPCYHNTFVRRGISSNLRDIDDSAWVINDGLTAKASSSSNQAAEGLEVELLELPSSNKPRQKTLLNLFPLHPTSRPRDESDTHDDTPPAKHPKLTNTSENSYRQPENLPSVEEYQSVPSASATLPMLPTGLQFENHGPIAYYHQPGQVDLADPNNFAMIHPAFHHPLNDFHLARLQPGGKETITQEPAPRLHFFPVQYYSRPIHEPLVSAEAIQGPPTVEAPRQAQSFQTIPWQEMRKHYSCQTLAWNPPSAINEKAALGAHAMVPEFQGELASLPLFKELIQMQSSHMIFVPFIYKLLSKSLNENHWSQILTLWHKLWRLTEIPTIHQIEVQSKLALSHKALKRFLWISDLIVESTIPRLYENSRLRFTKSGSNRFRKLSSFRLQTSPAKIIKYLSDGRSQNTPSIIRYLKVSVDQVAELVETASIDSDPTFTQPVDQKQLLDSVLDRLSVTAQVISEPIKPIVAEYLQMKGSSWMIIQDLLVRRLVYNRHFDPQTIQNKLSIFPESLQPHLIHIFHAAQTEINQKNVASSLSSHLSYSEPLEYMIKRFDEQLFKSLRASDSREKTQLLPHSIHAFFEIQLKELQNSDRPSRFDPSVLNTS
ncbi:hypothetical protein PGT21_015880 [Puccinia graminis f. sp. tritici]|uniref:Uncharacterized protein n=1 Tax=Puccinia graminis f. sp. tritici TaxID=56615 RepID=A0A5B0MT28_PUCGR|nr:hypothetical protein PGT21_015880 [Puccinia graminis f. sp. tritici]